MSSSKIPAVMIAAAGSGSGKTAFTCALLSILKDKGLSVRSFKTGPDYIDPMFHRKVLGVPSENLDTFFETPDGIKRILSRNRQVFSVIEGVMGIYDGINVNDTKGSCYEVSTITKTPIILIMDAKGCGRTIVSLLEGILSDDKENLVKGVIFNRMSENFYKKISSVAEACLKDKGYNTKLLGFIPEIKDAGFDSRHLGLLLPDEIENLNEKIDRFKGAVQKNIDIEGLISIAKDRGEISYEDVTDGGENIKDKDLVLSVARDEAFCFYYEENLRMFTDRGVKIRYFSPIYDEEIPEDSDAILIGGGYPELHLEKLSENGRMLKSVKTAVEGGIPTIAECGGYMYLHDAILEKDGNEYEMAGVIEGECSYKGHLVRFGYLEVCEDKPGKMNAKGMKGHEFHYYESTKTGSDHKVCRPDKSDERECIIDNGNCFFGFPHFYYPSKPEFVEGFIRLMEAYHEKRKR